MLLSAFCFIFRYANAANATTRKRFGSFCRFHSHRKSPWTYVCVDARSRNSICWDRCFQGSRSNVEGLQRQAPRAVCLSETPREELPAQRPPIPKTYCRHDQNAMTIGDCSVRVPNPRNLDWRGANSITFPVPRACSCQDSSSLHDCQSESEFAHILHSSNGCRRVSSSVHRQLRRRPSAQK